MADLVVIFALCILGLVAHGARSQPWMEWTLRVMYVFACVAELYTVISYYGGGGHADASGTWTQAVTLVMAVVTGGLLFRPFRRLVSYVLSSIEFLVDGQLPYALMKKISLKSSFMAERVFVPESIPHMNGLWIYITTLGCLLANINPDSWNIPSIGIPFPVPLDSLITYNLFGLVLLALCGVGILVTRKPMEALQRLGLVKPEGWHYGAAFFALLSTFVYDYIWSLYTQNTGIGTKLGQYNAATFTSGGGAAAPSALLAFATAICAGIGEETLMRGALQPVFGCFGAGMLHGILHGQFNHMPLLMIQIGVWSTMLGVLRKYTNTTTTIMTHGVYNLINTFLYAFNP